MFVCIYIHICLYIHTYINTHTHIHIMQLIIKISQYMYIHIKRTFWALSNWACAASAACVCALVSWSRTQWHNLVRKVICWIIHKYKCISQHTTPHHGIPALIPLNLLVCDLLRHNTNAWRDFKAHNGYWNANSCEISESTLMIPFEPQSAALAKDPQLVSNHWHPAHMKPQCMRTWSLSVCAHEASVYAHMKPQCMRTWSLSVCMSYNIKIVFFPCSLKLSWSHLHALDDVWFCDAAAQKHSPYACRELLVFTHHYRWGLPDA